MAVPPWLQKSIPACGEFFRRFGWHGLAFVVPVFLPACQRRLNENVDQNNKTRAPC